MTAKKPEADYEVVGKVKRLVTVQVTDADRARIDETGHLILEARKGAKANKSRLKAGLGKANERIKALDEQLEELHEQRKITTHDITVDAEIRRTATQVLVVSLTDGRVLSHRALTAAETEALAPGLPMTGPPPKVVHPEITLDDATVKKLSEDEAHAKRLADLLREIGVDGILAQVDADATGSSDGAGDEAGEDTPKKKRGKGRKAKQLELAANTNGKGA